jgi:hypothetical protein
MITRRELALEGALLLVFGGTACTDAHADAITGGCLLADQQARAYLAEADTSVPAREDVIASSGNGDFDYALAQTLSLLVDAFEVLPGFGFYKVGDVHNAYASTLRHLTGTDGTVLLGNALLFELMEALENPDAGVAAVCAHEFGHIVQFKRGLLRTLNAGQSTVKRAELNADFMSGYFAGLRKRERPDFPAMAFVTTQEKMGDYQFANPLHHGTPEERSAAIVRGFEVAYRQRQSLADAIATGINYVLSLQS